MKMITLINLTKTDENDNIDLLSMVYNTAFENVRIEIHKKPFTIDINENTLSFIKKKVPTINLYSENFNLIKYYIDNFNNLIGNQDKNFITVNIVERIANESTWTPYKSFVNIYNDYFVLNVIIDKKTFAFKIEKENIHGFNSVSNFMLNGNSWMLSGITKENYEFKKETE